MGPEQDKTPQQESNVLWVGCFAIWVEWTCEFNVTGGVSGKQGCSLKSLTNPHYWITAETFGNFQEGLGEICRSLILHWITACDFLLSLCWNWTLFDRLPPKHTTWVAYHSLCYLIHKIIKLACIAVTHHQINVMHIYSCLKMLWGNKYSRSKDHKKFPICCNVPVWPNSDVTANWL